MIETTLHPGKWRVKQRVVPVPKRDPYAHVRPWQLPDLPAPPETTTVLVYGIWPPGWPIEGDPLLVFPNWPMAFRAAYDRAEFAVIPLPPAELPKELGMPYGQT